MNDQDFDEIGHRLYDMEADPPKDGWDKIYGGLHTPPGGNGFFKKHWWKPLVILIPLATYFVFSDSDKASTGHQTAKNETAIQSVPPPETQISRKKNDTPERESPESTKENSEKETTPDQRTSQDIRADKPAARANDPIAKDNTIGEKNAAEKVPSITPLAAKKKDDEKLQRGKASVEEGNENKRKEPASGEISTAGKSGTKESDSGAAAFIKPGSAVQKAQGSKSETTTSLTAGQDPLTEKTIIIGKPQELLSSKVTGDSVTIATTSKDKFPGAAVVAANEKPHAVSPAKETEPVKNKISGTDDSATPSLKTNEISEDTAQIATKDHQSAFNGPPRPRTNAGTDAGTSLDTLARNENPMAVVKTDSSFQVAVVDNEENTKSYGPWRITIGIIPQYVTKTVKPLPDDEVLMFADKDKSFYREHIGLTFALGAGRAITPDFYIDAQLMFQKATQEISYSYSTGKVDTLIAQRQSDGSIKVSPVYELYNTQITADYTYTGLRLSGTYYFWRRPGGRFNLSFTGGASYLLSADIRETTAGQSYRLSEEYLDRVNYNISIGGGYNFMFGKGWELMINPMLTYYPSRERIRNLPFDFQQKSYGLNVMLSKNISSGK